MLIKSKGSYKEGMNVISTAGVEEGAEMDFSIYILKSGKSVTFTIEQETIYVLIQGEIIYEWEGKKEQCKRTSCFHDDPWALHVPKGTTVTLTGVADSSEIAIQSSVNDRKFPSVLLTPSMCSSEQRGAGTMRETATRIVRNILDLEQKDHSNFFMGEVITYPGKWSSYPPHEHEQPEIYYYKFLPEDGFGFSEDGDKAHKTHHNDTGLYINGARHCQASAPGYAMYYLWTVHHTPGNPHMGPVVPEELRWVAEPDAKYFPDI